MISIITEMEADPGPNMALRGQQVSNHTLNTTGTTRVAQLLRGYRTRWDREHRVQYTSALNQLNDTSIRKLKLTKQPIKVLLILMEILLSV